MNLIGIVVSLLYIFFIVGIVSFIYKKKLIKKEEGRKLIHIALSNCWLLAWLFFDKPLFACIVPFLFIIVNIYSYFHNTISVMERDDKNSFGTVWYAIAIFILSIVLFQSKSYIYIGAIAILSLGYGDGLAGLIGKKSERYTYKNGKTVFGSAVVFLATFIVTYIILNFTLGSYILELSIISATVGTVLELFSSKGLDNLLMPIGLTITLYFLNIHPEFISLFTIFAVNGIVAVLVYGMKLLNVTGTITALFLGVLVYYFGGVYSFLALAIFFCASNLLNLVGKKKKHVNRTMIQVLCNGLPSLVMLVLYYYVKEIVFLVGFLITLAGASSDTWSSELGQKGSEKVRYILSRKPVKKGLSGGVTKLGLFGALIGSLVIAVIAFPLFDKDSLLVFILVLIGGFLCSIIDSILGELLQAKYQNIKTKEYVEKPGADIQNFSLVRGFKYIENNMVNFISIIVTTILGCLCFLIF